MFEFSSKTIVKKMKFLVSFFVLLTVCAALAVPPAVFQLAFYPLGTYRESSKVF